MLFAAVLCFFAGAALPVFSQSQKPPAGAQKVDAASFLHAAEEALNHNDYAAAVKALKVVVEAQPDAASAWFNLGYAYTALHQDEEAMKAYEKTVELAPKLFEARLNLGILLVQMKQPQEALEQLQRAVELKPDHARAHLYYGRALTQVGQQEAALKEFQQTLRLEPRMAIAHFDLGQLYLQQKEYTEARSAFQRASELDPNLPQAELGQALASEGLSDQAQAITHFVKYLAADPDDLETRFHLARLYLQQGENEQARANLEQVYRANPAIPGLAAALGDVYALLKNFPESEKYYRQALVAKPDEPDLHRALGQSLLDQEKYVEAEAEFRTALKRDPRNRDAAQGLATSLYLQKRYPEVIPILEALAKAPAPPPILFFVLATSYDHLQVRDKALAAYEHFLQLSNGRSPDQEWQAQQRAKLLRRELRK